jgi:hypothetical protein
MDVTQFMDILPGETHRYDHTACTAGEDTRQRLYVTRAAHSNTLLLYCHNCQQGSRYFIGERPLYRDEKPPTPKHEASVIKPVKAPIMPNASTPIGEFHATSQAWLARTFNLTAHVENGGDPEVLRARYDIREHDTGVNPNPRGNVGLHSYQLRKVDARDTGPKYYSRKLQHMDTPGVTHIQMEQLDDVTVLVEDYMSGIAVSEAGYNAVVNYGVQKPGNLMPWLHKNTNAFVVWLDNDSDHVIGQSVGIMRQQQMFSGGKMGVYRITEEFDPKHLQSRGIRAIIEETIKRNR